MVESTESESQLAERLRRHVDVLAELIGPRHVGRPEALASAATYIERQFLALEDDVERQTYEVEDTTVANLIVERRGERRPDSIVVVGAHYDSVPSTPGADDNASAVAVLIEAARSLRGCSGHRTPETYQGSPSIVSMNRETFGRYPSGEYLPPTQPIE
jgi:acetylornithine deacetylase/succinyl-diaminopimelate desuccinylase-like protein